MKRSISFLFLIAFCGLMIFAITAQADGAGKYPERPFRKELQPNNGLPALDDGTPLLLHSRIKKPRLFAFWGGLLALDVYGFRRLQDFWYNQPTTSFHFIEGGPDWKARKQMDKIGHLMHAYFASNLSAKAYRWAGMSAYKSIWYGALTSWLWMLQIEIADGFFEEWGFSYYDFTANTLGAVYAALQQHYPEKFGGIRFKISYKVSEAHKKGLYSKTNQALIDDYEGMTFWLTANVHDLLPVRWKEKYPGWLSPWGIAVGYSAKDIANHIYQGRREVFIGLDFDLRKIPTGNSKFFKFVKDELNFIRLPLPAVRISPDGEWFLFYF